MRRDLAVRYLGETAMAVCEVAYLLGFSESSAFHRAFKRWTGTTPTEFSCGSRFIVAAGTNFKAQHL